MSSEGFYPVNFLVSLVVGWFVVSFLQSAARQLFTGNGEGLLSRFPMIAFFHDGWAAVINIAVMLTIGVVTKGLWHLTHHS